MRKASKEARASADLGARLRERRSEIERAVLTRIYGVADPGNAEPEYLEGLKTAVSAGLEYGICVVERCEERLAVPPALLSQARLAARARVDLETVLRRYVAGYNLLSDFVFEEVEAGVIPPGSGLKPLMRAQANAFERLVASISSEYSREANCRRITAEQRRTDCVEALLAGELVDAADLGYNFDMYHLGLIVSGPGASRLLQRISRTLDRNLLAVPSGASVVWGWLGGRKPLQPDDVEHCLSHEWPPGTTLALGEVARGLAGWRVTHRQAKAAQNVMIRGSKKCARYADVALVASVSKDELLSASLSEIYLSPLAAGPDDGDALRETLRAFFAADRNVSSAAAALGINRHTVTNRLRTVEERLGRSLNSCATEVDLALRLEKLQ
jgi:hypothetical protein